MSGPAGGVSRWRHRPHRLRAPVSRPAFRAGRIRPDHAGGPSRAADVGGRPEHVTAGHHVLHRRPLCHHVPDRITDPDITDPDRHPVGQHVTGRDPVGEHVTGHERQLVAGRITERGLMIASGRVLSAG